MNQIAVFSGSAHPDLAAEICAGLRVPRLPATVTRFSNDCLGVQLQANCREQDVFIIQPLTAPVQDHLVELLLMLDAARGASAARITAVIPHFAYARSDKKDAPCISIGGRLVADLLATAGANRVLTMTLHSPQVHGFFSVPVDHLHALDALARHFRRYDLSRSVVVSPDLGNAKTAAAFARRLNVPVAAGATQRLSDTEVRISALIGDVRGRDAIVLDDEISSGGSILELVRHLRAHEVRSIRVAWHARHLRRQCHPAPGRGNRHPRAGLHQHRADRVRQARAEAHRAFGRAGAGRSHAPDQQRRIGERLVRGRRGDPGRRSRNPLSGASQ
jgi:ribose-phosphate pyrophosphokinase